MKNVKDKIDTLSPLAGGIVFGKEEAWDKLQARMDKPAKRIALKPWLAAAAVLLLLVTVITAYYNIPGEQEIANEEPKTIVNTPQPLAAPQPVVQAIENNIPGIHKSVNEKEHKRPVIQEQEKQIITTEPIQVTEAIPDSAPVDEVLVMNNTTPALPSKIPTKVVHINEVSNNSKMSKPLIEGVLQAPVNLRVVHIHDVEREEFTIQNILRENNPGIGKLHFKRTQFKQDYNATNIDYDYYPDNPLKIQINLQN